MYCELNALFFSIRAIYCFGWRSMDVPEACLEGLAEYSHVWLLYTFHANTDRGSVGSEGAGGIKAKVCYPLHYQPSATLSSCPPPCTRIQGDNTKDAIIWG